MTTNICFEDFNILRARLEEIAQKIVGQDNARAARLLAASLEDKDESYKTRRFIHYARAAHARSREAIRNDDIELAHICDQAEIHDTEMLESICNRKRGAELPVRWHDILGVLTLI